MDLFRMKCFVSISKTLSVTKSAQELFISQPAMTQQLNNCEKELNLCLLSRQTRNVELTDTGKIIAQGFENILDNYEELLQRAKYCELRNKTLRIGYHGPTEWAVMYAMLNEFVETHQDAEFTFKTAHWYKLVNDLKRGIIDVIFTEYSEVQNDEEIVFVPLFTDHLCICMSKDNLLTQFSSIKTEQLKNEKIIMTNSPEQSKSMTNIIQQLSSIGIDMSTARYVIQFETAFIMAAAGLGVTPVPSSFKNYHHPALSYVDVNTDLFAMNIGLAYLKKNSTQLVKDFEEKCKNWKW